MAKDKGEDAWNRVNYEIKKRSTHEGLAVAASDGDQDSALKMVRLCRHAVGESQDIPDTLREYLFGCLVEIEQRRSADQAFNLTKTTAGRNNNLWKDIRDRDMAMAVQNLRNNGMKRDQAIAHVANNYTAFPKAGRVGVASLAKTYARFFPSKKGNK